MTAIEKFTFALSFDDSDNVIRSSGADDEHYEMGKKKKKPEEEAPPPPPAVYTEEQSAQMIADAESAARDQALAEGHAQGLEQGRQEILSSLEKASADCQAVIGQKLDQIDELQKRANARINEDAIHVALGVIRKLAPAWSKKYELTEIEDIVRQCLANLFEAPKVMIKVHPDLEQTISESSQKIAQSRGFSGNVVVVGEPDVAHGDCMVSWGDGTAVRDSSRIWSEVNSIVDTAMDLHSTEYDLPETDMDDPEIQESRLPAEASVSDGPSEQSDPKETDTTPETEVEPAAESQEHANERAPTESTDDDRLSTVTDSSNKPDLSTSMSNDVTSDDHDDTTQNVTSNTVSESAPSEPSEHHVKEGDGTDPRNVQTSPDDVMQIPDTASEMPVDPAANPASAQHSEHDQNQAPAPAFTTPDTDNVTQNTNEDETNATNQGDSAANQAQSPDITEPTKPHSAGPTSGTSAGQEENPENGSAPHKPQADDLAAVKQPTKDAGD